jgi:rhodanese-related sulfurtransferase
MSAAKSLFRVILFPALLLTFALYAGAEEKMQQLTPLYLPGGKVVSPVLAKKLHDNKEAKFYDTRSTIEFDQARIAGARLLPYTENSERVPYFDPSGDLFDTIQLPPNKGQTMIFYCAGPDGWKSYKAAVLAIKEGYRDVMWLRDGFSGWQTARFPVE